jgi:hypothetical protein
MYIKSSGEDTLKLLFLHCPHVKRNNEVPNDADEESIRYNEEATRKTCKLQRDVSSVGDEDVNVLCVAGRWSAPSDGIVL